MGERIKVLIANELVTKVCLSQFVCVVWNLPIISSTAVRWDVGVPTKPVAPSAAPPRAQAMPPKATTAIKARNIGPEKHRPQQPLPDRSEGDLKLQKKNRNTSINMRRVQRCIIIFENVSILNSEF